MTESGSKAVWYCASITLFLTIAGAVYAGWIYDQPNRTHYAIWVTGIGFAIVLFMASLLALKNKAQKDFQSVFKRKLPITERQREIVQRNVNYHLKNSVHMIEAAETEAENFMADIRLKSTLDDAATNQASEALTNLESKIAELRNAHAFKTRVAAKVKFEIYDDLQLRNFPA